MDPLPLFSKKVESRDSNGNVSACNQTLSIEDNIAPLPECQNATVVLDEFGIGTLTLPQVNNGSSDNCGTVNLSFAHPNFVDELFFDCDDLGSNNPPVSLFVTDGSSNLSSCEANITVIDNESPQANCQNITV